MSSRRREQILENCRWLFDQEVQIITFVARKYLKGTPDPSNSSNRGPFETHFYAAVLPKECTLRSLAKTDIEEKILFKEFNLLSTDGAISTLLETVEKKIGTVLEEDPENSGRIRINTLEVLDEGEKEQEEKQTVEHTTNKSPSSVPPGGNTPLSRTVSPSMVGSLPPAGTVSSDGVVPPISLATSTAQNEVLKLFFQNLRQQMNKKSAQVASRENTMEVPRQELTKNTETKTRSDVGDELSQRNLSLLDGRTKTKDLKMARLALINPPKTQRSQQKENPFSAPEPETAFPEVPEVPNENSENRLELKYTNLSSKANPVNPKNSPPVLPSNNSELEQRVAELEEKLQALDTLVKAIQTNPYHFRELSTPTDTSSPQIFPQILTPTTSVASDTTIPSRRVSMHKEPTLSDITRELIKAEIKSALGQGQPKRSKRRTGRLPPRSVPSSAFGSESEA